MLLMVSHPAGVSPQDLILRIRVVRRTEDRRVRIAPQKSIHPRKEGVITGQMAALGCQVGNQIGPPHMQSQYLAGVAFAQGVEDGLCSLTNSRRGHQIHQEAGDLEVELMHGLHRNIGLRNGLDRRAAVRWRRTWMDQQTPRVRPRVIERPFLESPRSQKLRERIGTTGIRKPRVTEWHIEQIGQGTVSRNGSESVRYAKPLRAMDMDASEVRNVPHSRSFLIQDGHQVSARAHLIEESTRMHPHCIASGGDVSFTPEVHHPQATG